MEREKESDFLSLGVDYLHTFSFLIPGSCDSAFFPLPHSYSLADVPMSVTNSPVGQWCLNILATAQRCNYL